MSTVKPLPAAPLPRPHDFPPLTTSEVGLIGRAREALDKAGYTKSNISEVLNLETQGAVVTAADLVRISRRFGGSPLETLIHLFVLGRPVSVELARGAVAPMALEEWVRLGLLQLTGSVVTPLYELLLSEGLLLALPIPSTRRPPSRETLELHRELRSARTWLLEQVTVRRPSSSTLDLTAGTGVHTLLAAGHSQEILAVDVNPRAVELISFNALLNGFSHIQGRAGEFPEAVFGRTFDLILCHPPFTIAPPPLILSRTARFQGDAAFEALVRSLPRFLSHGGYAHVLIQWAHHRGEDPEVRLRGWLAESGCDAWTLRFATQDQLSYALDCLPDPPDENLLPYERRLDSWLGYHNQQGIEAVSSGILTMCARAGGKNWFHLEDIPDRSGPCGDALIRGFTNRTFLSSLPNDHALLAARLRVVPEARWEHSLAPVTTGSTLMASQIHLVEGFLRALQMDENVPALLSHCDGQQNLQESLTELAKTLGQDAAVVIAEGIPLARLLLEDGFVEVVQA
jgi:hypothetical protein